MLKALAIVCAYNEADIIGWTVRHLRRQECSVHVIDCESTDDTAHIASAAGATIEAWPAPPVSWYDLLHRVEQVADDAAGDYAWAIHCDADEFRYSDVAGQTLREGLEAVALAGFTCVDHKVITFHPVDNGYTGKVSPEQYFRHYTRDTFNERIGQQKAWLTAMHGAIAWSGGHRVRFDGGGIVKPYHHFISKHYPIRSQQHGLRKVLLERRWKDQQEGRKDWHVQYDGATMASNFLKDPATLEVWQ